MKHTFSPGTIQIFIIYLLVFAMQLSVAQTAKIDSLRTEMETSKPDTNKVNILYYLSDALRENEPDKAIYFAKQGISLSEKLEFKKGQSDCLNAIGLAYYQKGNFDTALINFERRYQIVSEMNDSMGIASAFDNMGVIYLHFGENNKALEYRKQANNIYSALNRKSQLASGFTWLGNIYKNQGEYNLALENYLKALKIYEDNNDEQNIGFPLLNISSIYRYMKQYDLAKKYAFDAKEIFGKSKNTDGVGVALYRMAIIASEENKTDNAIEYLLDAKELFEETQNGYFLALVTQFLGTCYLKQGKLNVATGFFINALEAAEKIGDLDLLSTVNQNIGTEYYVKRDYFKALEYMQKSERILKEINDKHSLMKLSQNMIEIYSRINKPDSVIKYFQSYVELSDTLFSEKTAHAIAEMQTKYETEKREKELEFAAIKLRQQKSWVIYLAILVFILLVNSVLFYLYLQNKHKKNLLIAKAIMERDQIFKEETKYKIRNSVSDHTTKKILDKLVKEIEVNKCYLDPDINIGNLAQKTGTNREYLSQIINKTYNKNFNDFVNFHRVQESVDILKKIVAGELNNWTMEMIAEESGFKYTSTFYPAFKQVMNMSPAEFRKAVKNM